MLVMAASAGAAQGEVLLITANLDIEAGHTEDALRTLAQARALAARDPRVFLLLGEAYLRAGKVEQALQNLDIGVGMNPYDLPLLRRRLDIITAYRKWHLAKDALAALEAALAEAHQPTAELHLAAARYYAGLRDYGKASSEYNLVLMQDPGDVAVWTELGSLWEGSGHVAQALEAYRQANRMTPGNATIGAAIQRLEGRIQIIRAGLPLSP